jgi:hypothetical protein
MSLFDNADESLILFFDRDHTKRLIGIKFIEGLSEGCNYTNENFSHQTAISGYITTHFTADTGPLPTFNTRTDSIVAS